MLALASTCLALTLLISVDGDQPTVLVVQGVPGTPDYGLAFSSWTQRWREAAARAGGKFVLIGPSGPAGASVPAPDSMSPVTDHDQLRQWFAERAKTNPTAPLWLILIGHGTFDGRTAKFNLRGPDVTDAELVDWLKPLTCPVAVLDCTSSSGPFLTKLASPDRVVITATKSGAEQNYARLGQFLAAAWSDPHADLDKDGQTSLLEAFILAGKQTANFYQTKARLSTEHALIDDNGDGKGTPAVWFEGIRLAKKPQEGIAADGLKANQFHLIRNERDRKIAPAILRLRNDLEGQVAALQERKQSLEEAEYYRLLETLMVKLSHTYDDPIK